MITKLPPDPRTFIKRKVAWYVQEVLREGHVLDVFLMSSWDASEQPRVYIGLAHDDAPTPERWPTRSLSGVEIGNADLVTPPANYVIGDPPRGHLTKCMWCGDAFQSEDEVLQHEDQCDVA